MDSHTYFRINSEDTGNLSRTLTSLRKRGFCQLFGGCTAPCLTTNQLTAALWSGEPGPTANDSIF